MSKVWKSKKHVVNVGHGHESVKTHVVGENGVSALVKVNVDLMRQMIDHVDRCVLQRHVYAMTAVSGVTGVNVWKADHVTPVSHQKNVLADLVVYRDACASRVVDGESGVCVAQGLT